jgi:hypothetical protein
LAAFLTVSGARAPPVRYRVFTAKISFELLVEFIPYGQTPSPTFTGCTVYVFARFLDASSGTPRYQFLAAKPDLLRSAVLWTELVGRTVTCLKLLSSYQRIYCHPDQVLNPRPTDGANGVAIDPLLGVGSRR